MKINIEPGEWVGPFELGTPIHSYLSLYTHHFIPGGPYDTWDGYEFFDNTVEVYFDRETKIIESIACRSNCYWHDKSLIGLSISEFSEFFRLGKDSYKVETVEMSSGLQYVYDFDAVNLQLWTDENNEIVTVFKNFAKD